MEERNTSGINLWLFLIVFGLIGLHVPLKAIHDELSLNNDYTTLIIRRLNEINEKLPPSQEELVSPRQEQETQTFNTEDQNI